MSAKKVIYLKDYIKSVDGSLENKVVVGSDIRPQQAVNLAIQNKPIQVVTNDFDEWRVVRIKENISKFFDNPAGYLIDLGEEDSQVFQQKFFAQSKKKDFLLQVEQHLKGSRYRKVRDDIYLIADELFTNFSKSAKDEKTSMQFGIESNDETVVVYCRDSFGLLKPDDMLQNMRRCFEKGVTGAIKKDEGAGAGIGSYLMYTLGVGLAITVEQGQGALVAIWMPKNIHHEDRVELNKSLIIIDAKES